MSAVTGKVAIYCILKVKGEKKYYINCTWNSKLDIEALAALMLYEIKISLCILHLLYGSLSHSGADKECIVLYFRFIRTFKPVNIKGTDQQKLHGCKVVSIRSL
jgi:hypothetical protein